MLWRLCSRTCSKTHACLPTQVFVTCGTPEKRAFLLEAFPALREDHIGDSRSTSFEILVRMATGGAGVHLALNSLADDKLQVQGSPSRWNLPAHCMSAPLNARAYLLHASRCASLQ